MISFATVYFSLRTLSFFPTYSTLLDSFTSPKRLRVEIRRSRLEVDFENTWRYSNSNTANLYNIVTKRRNAPIDNVNGNVPQGILFCRDPVGNILVE
jgi:hypothetical protein